jgi:hypothetical protein
MNRTRSSLLLLLSPVTAAGACVLPEVEPELGTASSALCSPQYGCSGNASSMPFELDLGPLHQANAAGFQITSVIAPPPYTGSMPLVVHHDEVPNDELVVPGDELFGVLPDGEISGTALIGMTIMIAGPSGKWDLRLAGVSRFSFMVGGGQVTSYKFEFRPTSSNEKWVKLCPLEDEYLPENGEQHHALAFRGDRYNPKTEISESSEPWVNIACAGTAVAKLHLLRHTAAGKDSAHVSTIRERQAMLRMLRADYCGDGMSYTVDGTPLRYADRKNWHTDGLDLTQAWQRERVEALWDHRGAVCLDMPRKPDLPISCRATKPPCPEDLAGWKSLGHVVSANPSLFLPEPLNIPFPDQPPAP